MQKDKEVKTVGLGFVDALTLLFIALKLTGQIDWNWIWVLSPIWISISFLAVLAVVILLIGRIIDRMGGPLGGGSLLCGEVFRRPPPPLALKSAKL